MLQCAPAIVVEGMTRSASTNAVPNAGRTTGIRFILQSEGGRGVLPGHRDPTTAIPPEFTAKQRSGLTQPEQREPARGRSGLLRLGLDLFRR
jgi:hypothetical protein